MGTRCAQEGDSSAPLGPGSRSNMSLLPELEFCCVGLSYKHGAPDGAIASAFVRNGAWPRLCCLAVVSSTNEIGRRNETDETDSSAFSQRTLRQFHALEGKGRI